MHRKCKKYKIDYFNVIFVRNNLLLEFYLRKKGIDYIYWSCLEFCDWILWLGFVFLRGFDF